MGKLASKATKRIMASVLTIAMIMSNMTVYASEYSELAVQTDEAVENTETGAVELPSTEDGTVQDETTTEDETAQYGTNQDEGIPDETPSGEDASESTDNSGAEEGTDESVQEPEETDENIQEPEETDADIQETEDELGAAEVSADVETPTPRAGEHTMWIVGDSTVCAFTDKYYYPRYGYGTQIGNYLDDTYTIKNMAASGRSSKSYLTDNASDYAALTSGLSEGDVLVIGFGHNDEKNESARYTNPNGDYLTTGSFAKSLYDNYVKKAIDKKAQVILCTPIVRRNDSGTLSDANCHITGDATDKNGNKYPGGDYPAAIRKLVDDAGGADAGVYLVDLTELTKKLYNALGAEETLYLHAWTAGVGVDEETGKDPGDPKSVDNTHLNIYGAKKVAWMFAKELSEKTGNNAPEVTAHIKSDIASLEPTKEADLVSNPTYVKPKYTVPSSGSTTFSAYTTTDGIKFEASVFGDVGGASKISKDFFTFGKDANGNMQIEVKGQGKLSGSADGIAMYYYQIPVGKKFAISAKAKLNSIGQHNQVAFGLMARDDMYIDTYATSINSDYVVAGSLGQGSNCFYRREGALGGNATLPSGVLEAGKEYDLSIEYNGDGFACTFGDQPTQTAGYDFQLTSVDSQYVYVGMFVAREANVTFSDIHLEIKEDSEDPDNPDGNLVKFATAPHFTSETAPHPGTVLEVSYTLDAAENAVDASTVKWYRVEEGKEDAPLVADTDNNKKYTVVTEDIGKKIKVVVTPNIEGGKAGTPVSVVSQVVTDSTGSEDPDNTTAKPTAVPQTGSKVKVGDTVTLSSSTAGAKIIHTTDGSDPSVESTASADSPVTVPITDNMVTNKKVTIKAIAISDVMSPSGIETFIYDVEDSSGGDNGDGDITIDENGGIEIVGLDEPYYPYTGANVTPDFKVVDNSIKIKLNNGSKASKELTLGVDYTVKYKNNKNPGNEAEVIVVGKGNYAGKEVTKKFTIKAVEDVTDQAILKDLKGAKIDKIDARPYEGAAIYPNFKLTLKGKSAVEYTYDKTKKQYVTVSAYDEVAAGTSDVNVSVSNNVNKGTATILVTGKNGTNNKATSVKKTFKITPVDLSKADTDTLSVTVDSSVSYAVNGATPKIEVSYKFSADNVVKLVNGRDYTVKYSANKKAGIGNFTITGKGNYAKKYAGNNKSFTIAKLNMNKAKLVAVNIYDGLKAGKIKATVVDENDDILKASQYTVEIFEDEACTKPIDKNTPLKTADGKTYYVRASAKDSTNLEGTTSAVSFKAGKDIAKAKIKLKVKSMPYTGAEIKIDGQLDVTIKENGSNKILNIKDGDNGDYEIISYSNNINKGTATAVIRGIGEYSGTKTIKFKITAKTMKK